MATRYDLAMPVQGGNTKQRPETTNNGRKRRTFSQLAPQAGVMGTRGQEAERDMIELPRARHGMGGLGGDGKD